jgi:hypothetical protein
MNNQNNKIENYADDYSICLHADIINRMKRWNLNHSNRTSSVNHTLPSPVEYNSYYQHY